MLRFKVSVFSGTEDPRKVFLENLRNSRDAGHWIFGQNADVFNSFSQYKDYFPHTYLQRS